MIKFKIWATHHLVFHVRSYRSVFIFGVSHMLASLIGKTVSQHLDMTLAQHCCYQNINLYFIEFSVKLTVVLF